MVVIIFGFLFFTQHLSQDDFNNLKFNEGEAEAEHLEGIMKSQGIINKNLIIPPSNLPYKNRTTVSSGMTVDSVAVWIAPNPKDSLLFVTYKDGDMVSVWNFTTWTKFKDITGIDYPNGVAVDQAEGTLYVTVRNSDIVAKYFI